MEEESIPLAAWDKSMRAFNTQYKVRVVTIPKMKFTGWQRDKYLYEEVAEAITEEGNLAALHEKGVWLPRFSRRNYTNKSGDIAQEDKVLVKFETQDALCREIRSAFIWLYKRASKGENVARKQALVAKQAAESCIRATFKVGLLANRILRLEEELAQARRINAQQATTITQQNTTITGLRGMSFEIPVVHSVLKLPIRRSC